MDPAREARISRPKKRILALALGTVLSLLLGETLVRLVGLDLATEGRGALHAYDRDAGWTCRPDASVRYVKSGSFDVWVRCNSRGLRDDEHELAKVRGVRRIACLGDSFMWGYGVGQEEMFSERLERHLGSTESVNLGANGYSTVQDLIRLERAGVAYEPDWVVLFFYWNDLDDNFDAKKGGRPYADLDAAGGLVIHNRPVQRPWKTPWTQWLRHNSRLFLCMEYGVDSWVEKRRLAQAARRVHAGPRRSGPEAGGTAAPKPLSTGEGGLEMGITILDLYGPSSPGMDRAWNVLAAVLERVRAVTREAGARLLVVYVPDRCDVLEDRFAALERLAEELSRDRPSRRLEELCARSGIPCENLVPAFREAKDPSALYLPNNGHWSAVGHELAAERVAARIRALEGP